MDLYDLELHQTLDLDTDQYVIRVPGGWIYRDWDYQNDMPIPGGVFVPYNEEFKETDGAV